VSYFNALDLELQIHVAEASHAAGLEHDAYLCGQCPAPAVKVARMPARPAGKVRGRHRAPRRSAIRRKLDTCNLVCGGLFAHIPDCPYYCPELSL
jgi:hypothetical protein